MKSYIQWLVATAKAAWSLYLEPAYERTGSWMWGFAILVAIPVVVGVAIDSVVAVGWPSFAMGYLVWFLALFFYISWELNDASHRKN